MLKENQSITTQVIEDVVNNSTSDRIPISDLLAAMEGMGFGFAIMIFAFGITIPLPPPFPSLISLPLVIFSLQMVAGYSSPKLPKRFSKFSVKRTVLAMLVNKSSPYIRKVERILKPRLLFMSSAIAERIVGFFILVFSSFILLPMPLSNFIPGLGILIISFGLLKKDGLIIIFGITVGLTGLLISIAAVLFGVEVFSYLRTYF